MEQEVLLCPHCNAPHDEKLQPGTLQVECEYCGSLIVVPSHLGPTLSQQCPDHPESRSVGFCTACGRSCCDVCLRVLEVNGAPTYLCSECTGKREQMPVVLPYLAGCSLLACAVGGIAGASFLLSGHTAYGSNNNALNAVAMLFVGGLFCSVVFLCVMMTARITPSAKTSTLREWKQKRKTERMAPPGYAWKRCPDCSAGYFYRLPEIESARGATCQNCGRPFEMAD